MPKTLDNAFGDVSAFNFVPKSEKQARRQTANFLGAEVFDRARMLRLSSSVKYARLPFFKRDFVIADQNRVHAQEITDSSCFCMPSTLW